MTVQPVTSTSLHRSPPCSPRSVLLPRRWLIAATMVGFVFLAVATTVDSPLVEVDRSVQEAAVAIRSPVLTLFSQVVTELGGGLFTAAAAMAAAAVVWRRCHALAFVVLVAALSRPVLTTVLKEVVDRARPDLGPLAATSGASFPSGHVFAAVAFWALLPPVVASLTSSRRAWWASVAVAGGVVALVACSRVYLGVHWFTDVVGSVLVGVMFLLAVDVLLERLHRPSVGAPSAAGTCHDRVTGVHRSSPMCLGTCLERPYGDDRLAPALPDGRWRWWYPWQPEGPPHFVGRVALMGSAGPPTRRLPKRPRG